MRPSGVEPALPKALRAVIANGQVVVVGHDLQERWVWNLRSRGLVIAKACDTKRLFIKHYATNPANCQTRTQAKHCETGCRQFGCRNDNTHPDIKTFAHQEPMVKGPVLGPENQQSQVAQQQHQSKGSQQLGNHGTS